jgi:hypothetical protein
MSKFKKEDFKMPPCYSCSSKKKLVTGAKQEQVKFFVFITVTKYPANHSIKHKQQGI